MMPQAPDRRGARIVVPLADVFSVAALLVFSTSLVQLVFGGADGAAEPTLYRGVLLTIYAIAGSLAISSGAIPGIITLCPTVVLMLALPSLSVLWSVAPMETIERSVGYLGTIFLGLFLGWYYRLDMLLRLLGLAFLLGTLLSVLTIALLPSIGVDQSSFLGGSWRGIHLHKSKLGGASSA
ncbi:MAG: hypothetical protein R3349_02285, partial [Geminicoccaceae bacterium]|nr:hypothetical protein [Geminicoccaceae bacterium]